MDCPNDNAKEIILNEEKIVFAKVYMQYKPSYIYKLWAMLLRHSKYQADVYKIDNQF